jgi:hypothetical protein
LLRLALTLDRCCCCCWSRESGFDALRADCGPTGTGEAPDTPLVPLVGDCKPLGLRWGAIPMAEGV